MFPALQCGGQGGVIRSADRAALASWRTRRALSDHAHDLERRTAGTLPSDSVMFGILVLGTILLVGALSFLPALALGPVAEALQR